MGASTGPVLLAAGITAVNELVFAPIEGAKVSFNWRLIPAAAGLALALDGLERLAPAFATGLAWLCVATVLLVPLGNAPTPLETASRLLGYTKKVT
ncbi:MAG TPA: hypothetical protein VGG25_10290 [Streptosporangiaceae bacterium]|jgi:hypothetical protein